MVSKDKDIYKNTEFVAPKTSMQTNHLSSAAFQSQHEYMCSSVFFPQIFVSGIPGWHTLLFLPKAPLDPQEVHPHHQALTWFFIFRTHLPFMFRPLKSCPSQQTQASKAWTLVATCTAFMDFGLGMWRYDLWWCGQQLWTGATKKSNSWNNGKPGRKDLNMWGEVGRCWQMRRMGRSGSWGSSLHYRCTVLNLKPMDA